MGSVVLHIQKPKGNDARTSAHIERTIDPANADSTRTHLNKNLIEYPDGVENRTQAIQHRIENAKIKRKISHNQVRALQVMLSGTHEDMKRIQAAGKLDEWCDDNMEWLQDTFGKENVVSAVLHMDEKTPHIHATVVPIVQGGRRKAKTEENNGKKKYRKKSENVVRLCADDVMTRDNLKHFQDTYAEKMQKYGLKRGVKGSDAKHISTQQYYRDLYVKNEDLKEDIEILQERKEEVNDRIRDLYDRKDEAREKFLDMHEYVQKKEKELDAMGARLQQLRQDYEPYKAHEDLNAINKYFPMMPEQMRIVGLCEQIGLTFDSIRSLLFGKTLSSKSAKFYSPEHKQHFEAKDVQLKIEKEPDTPGKLRLSLNGQNILEWFKQ
ncbi:MAG: plasmid recombination protein, partial [Dysgonamonadaceae bacterium]|nr:plasmid recombination protein [Dysgonamonadaceae bacterium]